MKLVKKRTTVKSVIKRFLVVLLKIHHRTVVSKLDTGIVTIRTCYKNKQIIEVY